MRLQCEGQTRLFALIAVMKGVEAAFRDQGYSVKGRFIETPDSGGSSGDGYSDWTGLQYQTEIAVKTVKKK